MSRWGGPPCYHHRCRSYCMTGQSAAAEMQIFDLVSDSIESKAAVVILISDRFSACRARQKKHVNMWLSKDCQTPIMRDCTFVPVVLCWSMFH